MNKQKEDIITFTNSSKENIHIVQNMAFMF